MYTQLSGRAVRHLPRNFGCGMKRIEAWEGLYCGSVFVIK